ncbi:DUF3014 domain-containing protein [Sulfuricaulis sp.]|jgi:hypothetical protein|uniref:DUF3014 domain-containing protein n=1 Tax=Sulfuricaulis sp. TaxID=2003553 RepID=UPI00355ABB58
MKNTMWSVVVLVILGGIAAAYYYWQMHETPPPPVPASYTEAPPAPEAKAEPTIRHPVQAAPSTGKPLPPLGESDAAMQDELTGLVTQKSAEEFFELKEIVRRFVVTVDNLPRSKVPMRYRLFKPVLGKFLATGEGENFLTSPDNYRRYTPYIWLAGAVDPRKLVAVYVHFYPLFQQEYQNLGYPKGYFNDRLVEAIDDLLAAPDVPGRIKLVRPNVLYQFADPNLEDLSAGQKILIRMGSENAARIKAKLQDVRRELTTGQVPKS